MSFESLHQPFGDGFAAVYDQMYATRGKDYAAEASRIESLIRAQYPHARTLLDLACGTGEHLRHFRRTFEVEGLDSSRAMLDIASAKLPGVRFHESDLVDADPGKRFDVITWLFSSIGYLPDTPTVGRAVNTLADLLTESGMLAIETAVLPSQLSPPRPDLTSVTSRDGAVITRHTTAKFDGDRLTIDFLFTADPERNGFPCREQHVIRIFPAHVYIGALHRSGLRLISRTPFNRGTDLLLAVRHESCTNHRPCSPG